MERQFEDAFRDAFTVGVARVFAVAALVAVVCAVLAWWGIGGQATATKSGGQAEAPAPPS
jgi:hypothetical protein